MWNSSRHRHLRVYMAKLCGALHGGKKLLRHDAGHITTATWYSRRSMRTPFRPLKSWMINWFAKWELWRSGWKPMFGMKSISAGQWDNHNTSLSPGATGIRSYAIHPTPRWCALASEWHDITRSQTVQVEDGWFCWHCCIWFLLRLRS